MRSKIWIAIFSLLSINSHAQDPSVLVNGTYRWASLVDMCQKYPTDKCPNGHNFIETYQNIFAPMRDTMGKFLEIGIYAGHSHLMWREYFPPQTQIYGIDLRNYDENSAGSGVHTFVADQSKREDLQKFIDKHGSDFDVILDDGGHAMDHQQVSLAFLFKHLRPGGYFIIEDVHTSLPHYYPDPFFKVNEDRTNTTLYMLEMFVRRHLIISEYMTEEEKLYLQDQIATVDIRYRRTSKHSIMAIIRKKK